MCAAASSRSWRSTPAGSSRTRRWPAAGGSAAEPRRALRRGTRGGLLAELDAACRAAALRGAVEQGLLAPLTVFVNVEPEVLDDAPLAALARSVAEVPGDLRVVLEITERALAARPAELLRTVERVREYGWSVALDDVGADSLSLAEGIEDAAHLRMARALGATLGQGWLFGRPAPGPATGARVAALPLPVPSPVRPGDDGISPFRCLPAGVPLRRSPKALLIELSKQLERQAMQLGDTCVVAATFQEARHVTPATTLRYRDLVSRVGFVCALGEDLPVEPLPGLRGADLRPDDPVRGEWDVVVLSAHVSAALLARDLHEDGPDLDRTFEFALTYDRDTVVRAARALLGRVAPRQLAAAIGESGPAPAVVRGPVPGSTPGPGVLRVLGGAPAGGTGEALLQRALAATSSGVTLVDMRLPDQMHRSRTQVP